MEFQSPRNILAIYGRQAPPDLSAAPGNPYPTSRLQQSGFALLIFFPILAFVFVLLRCYSRYRIRQFGWDDGLIIGAMVFSIAETVGNYNGMKTGFLGIHAKDIPLTADRSIGMKWNYVGQIVYNPILTLVKSSVLLFMLRLGGHQRHVRYIIYAVNTFNILLGVGIFITVIFQCQPITYFWDRFDQTKSGKCVDTGMFYVVSAALTIFTDIMVLAFPFWIFIGLKLKPKVKAALMGVFLIGIVVTIVSILRLVWIVEISLFPLTPDFTYDIRFVYSSAETNLAIATACAPAMRPLLKAWFPKIFASLSGDTSGRPYGNKYGISGGTQDALKSQTAKQASKHNYGTSSYAMKDIKGAKRAEIREVSPSASEEQIMTYNGIVRTTQVDVEYGDKMASQRDDESASHGSQQTRFDY